MHGPAFHMFAVVLIVAAVGCEKQPRDGGGEDQSQGGATTQPSGSLSDAERFEAQYRAVYDLVAELIRRRHFDAAEVGIDHLVDLQAGLGEARVAEVTALRASLAAARGMPAPTLADPPTADVIIPQDATR